jgi:hypothetical protein
LSFLRDADIKPAMDLMSFSDEAAMREAGLNPEDVSESDRNMRIRAIDVMRTPKFDRVWQVGAIGEVSHDLSTLLVFRRCCNCSSS